MNEVDIIPFGKENRITKAQIAKELKIRIEEVDDVISRLRKKYIILSDTNIGGFWRPTKRIELLKFIRMHNTRHLAECHLVAMAWKEFDRMGRE